MSGDRRRRRRSAAASPGWPRRTRSSRPAARRHAVRGRRPARRHDPAPHRSPGHPAIDEGADAFLARVPWAVDLARKVVTRRFADITGESARRQCGGTACTTFPRACCWGCRPTSAALARSRCCRGVASCAPLPKSLLPRTDHRTPTRIGAYVRARFGDEVHERLVDPLDRQHLRRRHRRLQPCRGPADRRGGRTLAQRVCWPHDGSAAPPRPGRLLRAHAGRRPTGRAVCDAVVAATEEIVRCNSCRRPSWPADGGAWRVDGEVFDGVVLACPARAAAGLAGGRRAVGLVNTRRDSHRRCRVGDVGLPAEWLAATRLHGPVGLSRAEAAAASGHRGLVRFAEVGALVGADTSSCASRWDATDLRRCTSPTTSLLADVRRRIETSTSAFDAATDGSPHQPLAQCVPAVPATPFARRCVGRAIACRRASRLPAPATTASASPLACNPGVRRRVHCCSGDLTGRM